MEQFEEETILSSIQFITKVIQELGSTLPPDFATLLLGPGSYMSKLKYSNSELILGSLVLLYQTLLGESLLQNEIFG